MLATQVAPTAVPYGTRQPWLVRPSILRFVTSPYIGYASRPNRAIDGVGTSTPQDSRPCRPLPRHYLCHLCGGAWTHTPPCSLGAFTHVFPNDSGLTSRETRSAHGKTPARRLRQGAQFRGCSHSLMFRLPHSLNRATQHSYTDSARQRVIAVCLRHRVYESRVE